MALLNPTYRINQNESYDGEYAWDYIERNIDTTIIPSTLRQTSSAILMKQVQNFIKEGYELHRLRGRRNAHVVNQNQLESWLELYSFSKIILTLDDYKRALDHGLMAYYKARWAQTQYGTAEQRTASKMVEDYILGHLGELAFARFLTNYSESQEHNITSVKVRNLMDRFQQGDDIESPVIITRDIESITSNNIEYSNHTLKPISVKSSRMKSAWLAVFEKQLDENNPRIDEVADFYVFVRVDLPDDHYFRYARDVFNDVYSTGQAGDIVNIPLDIPELDIIRTMIVGYASKDDLIHYDFGFRGCGTTNPTKKYPLKDSRSEYCMPSGALRGRRRADAGFHLKQNLNRDEWPPSIDMNLVISDWNHFLNDVLIS